MRMPSFSIRHMPDIDPEGGFLCLWSHWRPDPAAPDPEERGLKRMMVTFLPCEPDKPCLCGSGKVYRECCRRKPYLHPICRNPGIETAYSLMKPRIAQFHNVDNAAVREILHDDERLVCTEDTPERTFWTYWGVPALEAEYGIICFGDIELKGAMLEVSVMSDIRWAAVMEVVRSAVGEEAKPTIRRMPVPKTPKPRRDKLRRKGRQP